MKSTICSYAKKVLALLSSSACVLSLLQSPVLAIPENLENRAKDFGITVNSEQSGKPKENMVDGNVSTLWVNNGADWPNEIRLAIPEDYPMVYKMVVKFERGHTNWSTDVKISHVVNNVVDQPVVDKTVTGNSFDKDVVMEWTDGIVPTEILVELSHPKDGTADGQYWPAIAEIEIYTEKQQTPVQPDLDLINVAPNGTISSSWTAGAQGTPANLTDNNYSSLYVFSKGLSTTGGQAWVQVDFDRLMSVKEIETAFENKGASDSDSFRFHYNILGRASDDAEWAVLAEDQTATRIEGDCIKKLTLDEIKELKSVRILITSIENAGGDPWPAIAELKINVPKDTALDIPKGTNIAEGKTIHTNTNQAGVGSIVDGSLASVWSGEMYPAYIDIDLGENYYLDDATVYTPTSGYSQYTIYTSMDGVDFDRVARKTTRESCSDAGEVWQLNKKEARIVRLYTEYNSRSASSQVREFVLHGEKSGTPVQTAPAVTTTDFDETEYAADITDADTINEVKGIISRRIGAQYVDWFTFELAKRADGYDYYDVEAKDGKIHITGNNGVSLATGLNAYLEKVVNVHISQVGDQVTMPDSIVLPAEKLHKETKFPVRYSYNFCTLSYSMAYWGEPEWRNELDWLALNGVNVVLDATGMEEVWRRFLSECGYSHQEIKDFICGPAYYAWFYMANMYGAGGPLPDKWFAERTELARKNHRIMQVLGMQPVLQGYCGMVPPDFTQKQPNAIVISQGKWTAHQRPYMLKTDDAATYDKYADMFYQAQKDVFGDVTNYYATDPFHEGGNRGGMSDTVIAQRTLAKMMDNDPEAVWIIQSWQQNPSQALLRGLDGNRQHALILDLYAERQPHWNSSAYGNEFQQTPWAFCMLNNFGGRLGLYGHLDGLEKVAEAANTAKCMAGIGITPEASENNPLLYEYIFDTIWTEDADQPLTVANREEWTRDYARRRYGAESENAYQALKIMEETVYAGNANEAAYGSGATGQGAPENIINSRPALSISAASTWGWSSIHYSRARLEQALELLLADYDTLKTSAGYHYDLIALAQQCISNYAQGVLAQMNTAVASNDLAAFTQWSDLFLELIDTSNRLLSTEKHFTLGNWTGGFGRLVSDPDDFTKDLFDFDAKALITTWGSITPCNSGGLKDYSNRQWSDLTIDVYKKRWEMFINEKKKQLNGESYKDFSANDWFELEWEWARGVDTYSDQPTDYDIKEISQKVLQDYSIRVLEPEITLDGVLDRTQMTATAGSQSSSDPASNVLDDNSSTIWHTDWGSAEGIKRENCWIQLDLNQPARMTALLYQPRTSGGNNGKITQYRIDVANHTGDGEVTWTTVATGNWTTSNGWKQALFNEPVVANKVRLIALDSVNIEANTKVFGSASEIRLKGEWDAQEKYTVTFVVDGTNHEVSDVAAGTETATVIPASLVREGYILSWTPALEAAVTANMTYNGVYTLDTKALSDKVDELDALSLNADNYTEETWNAYQAALNAANAVLASTTAVPADVTSALNALTAAYEALNPKPGVTVTHTLTVTCGAHGTASPAGETAVIDGSDKTITFTPEEGYVLSSVKVNGTAQTVNGNSLTLSSINANTTVEAEFAFDHYTASNPFTFPVNSASATLEAEHSILNNTGQNEQWPLQKSSADWASNGKFINACNENDSIDIHYNAPQAGDYTVVLTYRSGSASNSIDISEPNGNIENVSVAAGSDSVTTTKTKTFTLRVLKAGPGVLHIAAGANKAPQMDKFDITAPAAPVEPVKLYKDALQMVVDDATLDDYSAFKDADTLKAALVNARQILETATTQEEIDQAAVSLNQLWLSCRLKPAKAALNALTPAQPE